MSPTKSARCMALKWLRGTDDNATASTSGRRQCSFLPPRPSHYVVRCVCRVPSFILPFHLSVILRQMVKICDAAPGLEGRAVTVLQLGPAYCFFRAKGLTYEPRRRMGASETTVPAGHLCSSCDDSETCSVRRLSCMSCIFPQFGFNSTLNTLVLTEGLSS